MIYRKTLDPSPARNNIVILLLFRPRHNIKRNNNAVCDFHDKQYFDCNAKRITRYYVPPTRAVHSRCVYRVIRSVRCVHIFYDALWTFHRKSRRTV